MDSLIKPVELLMREVAEREILSRFGALRTDEIHHKDVAGDLVTTADLEAEYHLGQGLTKLLPGSLLVGEEEAYNSPEILDRIQGSAPVWVIDPLDGTNNFAKGKPCFAVICALVQGGITQMGWILDPVAGVCITAERGQGAWMGKQRLSLEAPLDGLKGLTGSLGERVQERSVVKALPVRTVRYHCVGREYMDLALGKIHFALYGGKMMPWDHAAGALIVDEAGGMARTLPGHEPYVPGQFAPLLIAPDALTFSDLAAVIESR